MNTQLMKQTSFTQHSKVFENDMILVVSVSDYVRLDALVTHNVHLFISNKSAQPRALVIRHVLNALLSC